MGKIVITIMGLMWISGAVSGLAWGYYVQAIVSIPKAIFMAVVCLAAAIIFAWLLVRDSRGG
jgi:hypothetical protein